MNKSSFRNCLACVHRIKMYAHMQFTTNEENVSARAGCDLVVANLVKYSDKCRSDLLF